jgi:hypothetical protein
MSGEQIVALGMAKAANAEIRKSLETLLNEMFEASPEARQQFCARLQDLLIRQKEVVGALEAAHH